MRILVTNDDGVKAPGLAVLAEAVQAAGHDLVVAAPAEDMTGSGAAIGILRQGVHIPVERVQLEGLADTPVWSVDGPPAVAVMAARLGGFGDPPDLVISGINPGANTGRSTLHSGTVGAVLSGANYGCSGLALSVDVGDPVRYDTAAAFAAPAIGWLAGAPAKTVLNVNVPDRALTGIAGVRWARLAAFGRVRSALEMVDDTHLEVELVPTDVELAPDTDTATVAAGYVAVTSLLGIRAAEPAPGALESLAAVLPGGGEELGGSGEGR